MLVKIKVGDKTLEFSSTECAIAILLKPEDRDMIEKMDRNDQLILSAPYQLMKDKTAETWDWAMTNWKGAQYVPSDVTQLRKF